MPQNTQTAHKLNVYIEALRAAGVLVAAPQIEDNPTIEFAIDNSQLVQANTLFVCKGARFHREYLLDAIEQGAVAYVSETDYEVAIPHIAVNDIRRALGCLADLAYNHPSGELGVCAFTGTKGKTTSAYYLKSVLELNAQLTGQPEPALFSSIDFNDGVEHGRSKLTTPESFELQRHLRNAVLGGCKHVVMEASSQALKYDRTFGIEFAVGAFTNIGEDHISPIEHPTFEDYFSSKLKLFSQCRCAVVNLDIDHLDRVVAAAQVCERTVTYSLENPQADVYAEALTHGSAGITATVHTPRFTAQILISTPVKFNVSNALAAIACAEALGIEQEAIIHGFEHLRVPGRMELYPSTDGNIIGVVDYAHNGMSLETMLCDLRENYPERELAVVFGATGGKGVDRRETMGIAAGKYADRIVITEDDPGPEDPADICQTIAHFVEKQGNHNWQIVLDRVEAIRTCVRETTRPAVVIVTGKGEENRMLRKHGAEPCPEDGPTLQAILAEA